MVEKMNWSVISSNPLKGPSYFLEQNTLASLVSTGWFQETICAWLSWAKLIDSRSNYNKYKFLPRWGCDGDADAPSQLMKYLALYCWY